MLAYSSRPPDPVLAGNSWRQMWEDRLGAMPFLATEWLTRQSRDDYWKHGSICEDYSAITAATLSLGGWHDGYRNTPAHLAANLTAPVKAIVGPWIHKYPHFAGPEPRIGFCQEALRWWDHWLKGAVTGVVNDPAMRLWLMDSVAPARWLDKRPGRWIAEATWPSAHIHTQTLHLGAGTLGDMAQRVDRAVCSPADTGAGTGEYFPFSFGPELPDDQQGDDGKSLCFDGPVTDTAQDIVGAPQLHLVASADTVRGQVIVRLCDLRPDGTSALISLGVLNLTHRSGSETPEPVVPGDPMALTVTLDQCAYRLPAGHRLRVAISTAYWPFLWPAPEPTTLTIDTGHLHLPLRPLAKGDEWVFDPPEGAAPWAHEVLRDGHSTRETLMDDQGRTITRVSIDNGEARDLAHGLISGSLTTEEWTIHPDDPLSASVTIHWEETGGRDGARTATLSDMVMTCDAENFHLHGRLRATLGDETVFDKTWEEAIPRLWV
jgi:predicted acyl esterase